MRLDDAQDTTLYAVVVNGQQHYSIWPAGHALPPGWSAAGREGGKDECLAWIQDVHTAPRPRPRRETKESAAPEPARRTHTFPDPPAP
jgi:MbtH protein